MTDWGLEAHRAAEAHLEACWEALMDETEGGDGDWPDVAAPFCGCHTCEVREVLHAAWPYAMRARFSETTADPPPEARSAPEGVEQWR